MLTLDSLTVRYGDALAVDGVDLTVQDGQILALLGPSGCGKSTLLRAVAGLEPVAGGSISWDGRDLARVPVHRRGFGLMFQDGVLFPHRSVAGNVAYGLARSGHDRAERAARVSDLLDLVGLAGYGERGVSTLSGGEQQRVALARSLAPAPRLLLLDEPLAALDRALRDRLLADLRDVLGATGTTALFVTHDQGEAFAVADVVALMDAGRIRQTGAPGHVWRHPADEWVARFVGYTSVLSGLPADGGTVTAVGVARGEGFSVALRPTALQVDHAGEIRGSCLAVVPGPEGSRVTVAVPGVGVVQAVAGATVVPELGDEVQLRFDPSAAAVLPGDPQQCWPPDPRPLWQADPVIPLRTSALIDAPEAAVRRALLRADLWTRAARALGGRGQLVRDGGSRVLRDGDVLDFRRVVGRRTLRCTVRLEEDGLPTLVGTRFEVRLQTAPTGAGTVTTIDLRVAAAVEAATFAFRRPVLEFGQMLLGIATLIAREPLVVMAGAVIRDGRLLVARRSQPAELAGRWELPGGKVEDGETEQDALARELVEELGITVRVGERLGTDVDLGDGLVLRTRAAALLTGEPAPTEHDEIRWVGPEELDALDWLPADRSLLDDLAMILRRSDS